MSHPGYGRPVDALDRICKGPGPNFCQVFYFLAFSTALTNFLTWKKEYRSCVKCLKDTHGDACIPEVTKYRWRQSNGEIVSSNQPGTCERDTFECDLRLAVKLAQKDYTLNDN